MKIEIKEGVLYLFPETEEDKVQLEKVLGKEYESDYTNHGHEFETTYGKAVYRTDDEKGIEFLLRDAWWNRDD